MDFFRSIYRILRKLVVSNAITKKLREFEYNSRFATATRANLFRGVFSTFDEALRSAPPHKPIGYNHEGPSAMYRDRMRRVYPADYPVLFWLSRIMHENQRLFDLGGHVGISYYAYEKYLNYPESYQWVICDVPAVTRAGELIQKERSNTVLSFTNAENNCDGSDILLASGSLQYLDYSLSNLLNRLENRPSHIIINLLPLSEGEAFVTLQNIGTAFCPYRIFNKDEFITSLCLLGYEIIDLWENAEKSLLLPLTPEKSLDKYHGMYLRASDTGPHL